ncbi:MAG: hypothetical protein WAT81_05080 [Candidatus Moraniibacteriota bacterium]
MSEPMTGPFAGKLEKAVVGRELSKATPDAAAVAAGLDLSGGGKPGREKGQAKHERRERKKNHDGAGVSGRSVHTRGQFVEAVPVAVPHEEAEKQFQHETVSSLVDQLNAVDERLQELFQEYPEVTPTIDEIKEDGSTSEVDAKTIANEAYAAAGRDAAEYENTGGEISQDDFDKVIANLSGWLDEMLAVEDCFREAVKLPKFERAAPQGRTDQASPRGESEPRDDSEYPETKLFAEKLVLLEERMGSWMEIRRQILKQGDPERLNADLKGLEVRDLAKKRVLESVMAEIAMHRQSLAEGQKPDGEAQAWLDRHLAGLDEILAAGVAIREQILKERALEAEQTKQAPEHEEDSVALPRSYASFDYQERQKIWREMRGKPMEKVTTVIDQLEHWKRFDDLIRQFHNESRFKADLINRDLGEKYAQVLALTGRNDEVTARLKKIKKQVETDGELNEKDAGFLTAMFFDYHELLVVGEQLMQERDKETSMIEAEKAAQTKRLAEEESVRNKAAQDGAQTASAAVAAGEKSGESLPASFEGQMEKLTGLIGRWNALGAELGWPILYKALQKERKEKIPPVKVLEDWLAKKSVSGAWDGKVGLQDRGYVEREVLPDMKKLVRQAEAAAIKWRAQQELNGTVAPGTNEPAAESPAVRVAPETKEKGDEPIVRGDVWEASPKDATHTGRRLVVTGVTSEGKMEYRFYNFDEIGNAQNMGFGMHESELALREWLAAEGFSYKERREDEVEPPAASVVTLARRPVIDGELTEWKRMNPVEQNRIRRTLFEKRNEYLTRANMLLKKSGVDRAVDRQKMVRERLEKFMTRVIEKDITGVSLTDSDRASLMRELEKETEAFFAE